MTRFEYMQLKLSDLPDDVVRHYKLSAKGTKDGYVYVEIWQGMYGFPQAGLIAQKLLEQRLNKEGYYQSERTPGLWTHTWRPIIFSLCVDDFGIKYVGKTQAGQLLTFLQTHYKILRDWSRKRYLGIDLYWDYVQHKVHLSVLTYVSDDIKQFHHQQPHKPQDQPYSHIKPIYGGKVQYVADADISPPLKKSDKKSFRRLQELFYTTLGRSM